MRILFIGVPVVELGQVNGPLETDFEYVITNTLDLPEVTYRKLIFYNTDVNYHKWFTIPKEKLLLANAPAFLNYQTFDATKPLAEVIREDIQSHLTNLSQGAMQASESVPIIEGMGFRCVDPMFTNAGPDGDYGFINTL
jgi:hypothetical protein